MTIEYKLRLTRARMRVIKTHSQLIEAYALMQQTALERTPLMDGEDDALNDIADCLIQAEKAIEDVTEALKEVS